MESIQKRVSPLETSELLSILKQRFEANRLRHSGITWENVEARLLSKPEALWSLQQMEETGGEPDVLGYETETETYLFCDCAEQSPAGRRNLCYDKTALEKRKNNKPQGSALQQAEWMGITVLTEEQYRAFQQSEVWDTKTSSWIITPESVRNLGGALFCDRRYQQVFVYHNSAESYYSSRGFRGVLRV